MNTEKLREALIELRQQRALLDGAITNLEGILKTLNGAAVSSRSSEGRKPERESYIDLGVRIIEEAGKAMHVMAITEAITRIRGEKVSRGSVESSFIRHIKTYGPKSRLVKAGPSRFSIPAFRNLGVSVVDSLRFEDQKPTPKAS